MINEQVKNYFFGKKIKQIYKLVEEAYANMRENAPCIYLEAAGDNVLKINIDDADLRWVRQVRILFLRQNPSEANLAPAPHKILAARYALLHPDPLHHYAAKWEDGKLRIYEHHGKKSNFIATVNDQMRKLYGQTGHKANADDETIAKWWMEENKNCIHDPRAVRVQGKAAKAIKKDDPKMEGDVNDEAPPPNAQVKISRRSGNKVDLEFRRPSRGIYAKYGFIPVKNIHTDMEAFKKKVKDEGFDEKRHANSMVGYTRWEHILEPESIRGGKASKEEDNPRVEKGKKGYSSGNINLPGHYGVSKSVINKKHPGFISPDSMMSVDDERSEEFIKQYSHDHEFRDFIEDAIVRTLVRAISMRAGAKVTIKSGKGTAEDKVFIKPEYMGRGVEEDNVKEILQEVRIRFINVTGLKSDEIWKNWREHLGKPKEGGLNDWIYKWLIRISNNTSSEKLGKKSKHIAGTMFARGSADPGGDEGHEDFGAFADKRNVATGDEEPVDHRAVSDDEREDMRHTIMTALKDPALLKNNPQLVTQLKAMAQNDPSIADALKSMNVDLDQLAASQPPQQQDDDDDLSQYGDDDDFEDGPGTLNKYQPSAGSVRREGILPFTFQQYLYRRVNEMGLPWGNDKNSAKIIKPGQKLKGGIQVQGAPWTAGGGPNYSGNDVKVK